MRWKGEGNSSINVTQRDVMASMIAHGVSLDEATATMLDATRKCVEGDQEASGWDWQTEELNIAYSGARFINKNPQYADRLPDDLRIKFEELTLAGKHPAISKNMSGLYVRAARGCGDNTEHKAAGPEQPQAAKDEPPKSSTGKRVLELRPFKPFDVAQLPPRSWLYGRHYQRRTVSLTAGPGGMGKSSLDMVEAIAMATCRNLLGEQPEERLRVWYHNGEDPRDEINRRLAAICQHYRIPQEELEGYLWTTSGTEFPLRVAKGYANLEVNTALVRQISAAISDNQIDIATFDPFVTLHSVSEVDTGKMDAVVRLFAGIADENDASIEIAHHVRKPAAGTATDYDVHDIRGVAAITDAVRAARVLNRMNERDAESAGCAEVERLSRFRVDRAKGNYSPAQAATWRQFVSVALVNGDDVGVVAPWNFPGQGEQNARKGRSRAEGRTRVHATARQVCGARHQRQRQRRPHLCANQVCRGEGSKNGEGVQGSPQGRHGPTAGRGPHPKRAVRRPQ